jgi:hypothetical protein
LAAQRPHGKNLFCGCDTLISYLQPAAQPDFEGLAEDIYLLQCQRSHRIMYLQLRYTMLSHIINEAMYLTTDAVREHYMSKFDQLTSGKTFFYLRYQDFLR